MFRSRLRAGCLILAIMLAGISSLAFQHQSLTYAASVLTVTTTADMAPPCKASAFSLRCAITRANKDGSGDTIFANANLGIDLFPQGVVNCNSSPPGPNDNLHCPVIQHATTTQASGTACANCLVEVFLATNEADDQGHGEGKTFLGRVTADSSGNWSLSLSAVTAGQQVTATATTTSTPLETFEFSANVVVTS